MPGLPNGIDGVSNSIAAFLISIDGISNSIHDAPNSLRHRESHILSTESPVFVANHRELGVEQAKLAVDRCMRGLNRGNLASYATHALPVRRAMCLVGGRSRRSPAVAVTIGARVEYCTRTHCPSFLSPRAAMPLRPYLSAVIVVLGVTACSSSATSAGSSPSPAASAGGGPAAKPVAPVAAKLPPGVTAEMIALGDSLFNNASCQRCHGKGAVGATNAPSLIRTTWDHGSGNIDDIVKTIIAGVPKDQQKDQTRPFAMRARGGVNPPLTDDQVRAIAAYIYSLNHK
jgi:mono/diheme cytochrome c family protein